MEQKFTKYGVSVAVLSMIGYFLGYYSLLAAIIMLVFILYMSESNELKKNLLQAVIFSLFISVAETVLNAFSNGYTSLLSNIFSFIKASGSYDVYNVLVKINIADFLVKLVRIFEFIAMLVFVAGSIKGKAVKVPFVSKMIDKHLKDDSANNTAA